MQPNMVKADNMAKGSAIGPHAYHSLLFNLKVSQGQYPKEKVVCFCGSSNHKVMTKKDRYGIDYSLCLCIDCGILYSNPRMTDESFKKFYENDYRNIYSDAYEIGEYENKLSNNDERIKDLVYDSLKDFEVSLPKVIFEIGCGTGTNLKPFRSYDHIGVDFDESSVKIGKAKGLNLRVGGIEVLELLNKKADLIIMNHVLEHMTDIDKDLKRVRELLSDNGVLYVAVPGLFHWQKESLIQNAHNYQFTGNTLCYVMNCCGFEEYFLSETVSSLWHKSDFMDKRNKNSEEFRPIESYLNMKENNSNFLMPQVRLNSKFTLTKRRNNIKYAIQSGVPEISELTNIHPDSEAVIIGGGPSVEKYVKKIKELKLEGAKIYSIERMYQWCLKNKIKPDYVVALDASDDVVESFTKINEGTTHLIVSQAIPEVFDKLKKHKAFYFNLKSKGIDFNKLYKKPQSITFINSGASVTLCCVPISQCLGARKFHIFGFDCHLNEKNYAKGITGVGAVKDVMKIEIEGRTFKTTTAFYAFMQQFFAMYQVSKSLNLLKDIKVYGDSMVKAASKIEPSIDGDKRRPDWRNGYFGGDL